MTVSLPKSHDEFVRAVIAYLNENAGEHRRARYHADIEREPGELRAAAFRGAGLKSEDAEAIEQDLDFVGDILLDGALDRLVEETNPTAPIATLDFVFRKSGKEWAHRGFIHSVSERRALDVARAPLDERLRGILLDLACPAWSLVALEYQRRKPLNITCLVGRKATKFSATEAIDELIAEYEKFFDARSLELQILYPVVRAKAPDVLELDVYYGVPHDD